MPEVAVVGGGVAGLVASLRLSSNGVDVTLFERRDEVGGRVRSERRDGYVFDRGFQVLFTAYPEARRYLDYDDLELRSFDPGARIASSDGVSTLTDPLRDPNDAVDALLSTDVTLSDKLRTFVLRERLRRKDVESIYRGDDASIEEYLAERGFSEKFVHNFAEPFYGGITLDPSLSTSKRVFEFTFKMLSEGDTVVPARGMASVPEQLSNRAVESGVDVRTGVRVEALETEGSVGVVLPDGTSEFDAAVVATDPKEAMSLTRVESVPTEPRGCVTQYYCLNSDDGVTDSMGKKILLNSDGVAPNLVAPLSNVAPEYAPDGSNLLSAQFLADNRDPSSGFDPFDEAGSSLRATTEERLESWYGVSVDIELLHTDTREFAQFAQPPGIHERLPGNSAPEGNLFLAGDYTEDSSINGGMRSGRKAADAALESLN
ncbi:MAG: NAD(P)/FAD-dependent oxidoreductase [Halobacteria archaeon]|nr:NAD(P)/FAD-dependent oxidoreductase [Halobacteria archaeon]